MNSRENTILSDLRFELRWTRWNQLDSVKEYYDYLTTAFGATAANDGLYTPEEIEHATKVLGRLIRLGGTE